MFFGEQFWDDLLQQHGPKLDEGDKFGISFELEKQAS